MTIPNKPTASGTIHGEPCVLMASASLGSPDAPVWIQLAKQGRFLGHAAGPFEMNAGTFDEIVRNFKAHPENIPIDFEHASEADASSGSIPHTGAPAQGWIVDMKVENGGLWGLVEWGSLAREYIKNGQYKYFSPAIRFNAKDRVTGKPIGARMTSGALTNSPFLSGLQKVAAKDALGADEHASADDDLNTKSEKSMITKEQYEALVAEKAALSSKVDALTAQLSTATSDKAALSLSLKDVEGKLPTLEEEIKTLRAFKAESETRAIAERVDLAFSTYKDEKKLTDADKEAMTLTLSSRPELFERLYPKAQPGTQHLLRNLTEKTREAPATMSDATEDAKVAGETFPQTVKRLMSEKKLSYAAASNMAFVVRQ